MAPLMYDFTRKTCYIPHGKLEEALIQRDAPLDPRGKPKVNNPIPSSHKHCSFPRHIKGHLFFPLGPKQIQVQLLQVSGGVYMYVQPFQVSSPVRTLHTAITHEIIVLELWGVSRAHCHR